MTKEQWLALEVGDVIRDRLCGNARREVLSISRVSGRPGQRGKTRTSITVANLKSPGRTTVLFSTDDANGERFVMVCRCFAREPGECACGAWDDVAVTD